MQMFSLNNLHKMYFNNLDSFSLFVFFLSLMAVSTYLSFLWGSYLLKLLTANFSLFKIYPLLTLSFVLIWFPNLAHYLPEVQSKFQVRFKPTYRL
jgi:amino acid transporter